MKIFGQGIGKLAVVLRNRRGVALVEFAFLAPVFVLGVFYFVFLALNGYDRYLISRGTAQVAWMIQEGPDPATISASVYEKAFSDIYARSAESRKSEFYLFVLRCTSNPATFDCPAAPFLEGGGLMTGGSPVSGEALERIVLAMSEEMEFSSLPEATEYFAIGVIHLPRSARYIGSLIGIPEENLIDYVELNSTAMVVLR